MPKVTKKKSKTLKKTSPKKIEEMPKPAPPIEPGYVNVMMSPEDLRTLANLMTITSKTFEKLAMDAAQANDEPTFTVLQARYKLSKVFAERLAEAYHMPEPISRDVH